MRVTLLGCGGSGGVPLASGDWGRCDPTDPRNRRRRPSILLEIAESRVLVDAGPDFREQWLGVGGGPLDAVIYTHAHADHTHGIDDLRALCTLAGGPVAVYGEAGTLERLGARFGYAFGPDPGGPHYYRPCLDAREIAGDGAAEIAGLEVRTFAQRHGRGTSSGIRIGKFAYSTDVSDLDEQALGILEGVDVWIVGAGAFEIETHNHATLDEVLGWIGRVRPKEAILTHLGPDSDYRELARRLPEGVRPGIDGMVAEVGPGPPIISHNDPYATFGSGPMEDLRGTVARLRAPTIGCPWDIEQNFATIAPFTIEEAYEVDDAIRSGDMAALRDELGDLLFQVVLHARMAEELGAFDLDDVARAITDKMVRRHPHVFPPPGTATGTRDWEGHKEAERLGKARGRGQAAPSALDDLPGALPALLRAEKLQKRAARKGFDWRDLPPVRAKIAEELEELDAPGADKAWEMGDVLFSAVNLARKLSIQPETALREANARFERRFRRVEDMARRDGVDMASASPGVLDDFWERAKREERT